MQRPVFLYRWTKVNPVEQEPLVDAANVVVSSTISLFFIVFSVFDTHGSSLWSEAMAEDENGPREAAVNPGSCTYPVR